MAPIQVLLVDDSDDMRLLSRMVLESDSSFEVWGEAANGQEALDLLAIGAPDVVVLDLVMPVMDGLTALPLLRSLRPGVPVVVMSATVSPAMSEEILHLGAQHVLTKRDIVQELCSTLRRVCSAVASPGALAASPGLRS